MHASRQFSLGNLVNLITLVIGLSIGFVGGMSYQPRSKVEAQAVTPTSPNIQDVSPTMTVGSIGTNLLLAHEVDADQVVINGYDVMKLQQGVINYLSTRPGAEGADFTNIVNSARATTLHRIKLQTATVPPPTVPPASVANPNGEKKQ
jgi:hypothetical protein